MPMNMLHSLQSSVTQEIHFCMELTKMELDKGKEYNATLHAEYSKLLQEWDQNEHREGRLKNTL
jgi:FtsZ-binding cell division protein ZapB